MPIEEGMKIVIDWYKKNYTIDQLKSTFELWRQRQSFGGSEHLIHKKKKLSIKKVFVEGKILVTGGAGFIRGFKTENGL